jgi:hypothetical protein
MENSCLVAQCSRSHCTFTIYVEARKVWHDLWQKICLICLCSNSHCIFTIYVEAREVWHNLCRNKIYIWSAYAQTPTASSPSMWRHARSDVVWDINTFGTFLSVQTLLLLPLHFAQPQKLPHAEPDIAKYSFCGKSCSGAGSRFLLSLQFNHIGRLESCRIRIGRLGWKAHIYHLVRMWQCPYPDDGKKYLGLARTIYIYTVYIQYFWQKNHQIYGHIRCIYTVLVNPWNTVCYVGLARTIYRYLHVVYIIVYGVWKVYVQCMYGIIGREFTKYTVVYGVHAKFWPILMYILTRELTKKRPF